MCVGRATAQVSKRVVFIFFIVPDVVEESQDLISETNQRGTPDIQLSLRDWCWPEEGTPEERVSSHHGTIVDSMEKVATTNHVRDGP